MGGGPALGSGRVRSRPRDAIQDHIDQRIVPTQRGFQFPGHTGETLGQAVAVFGKVQRGVAAGREKERNQQYPVGSSLDATCPAGWDVRLGELQESRLDQVVGASDGQRIGQPLEISVG